MASHLTHFLSEHPLVSTCFSLVGIAYLTTYLLSFSKMIWDIMTPGIPLSKFGAKKGAWAVVTGATAGIGRDFSLQLAKAGFNILLASRTESKLNEIAQEIHAKYPTVKTKIHTIDFSTSSSGDYEAFGKVLETLEIGVLVNNVGKSYDNPVYFQDLPTKDLKDIIEINCSATLLTTHLILPQMLSRKRGLIITVGSFASLIPSPLLAVYSGSKAFLKTWSQALGSECAGTGVEVELLNTYFVVSKLSKIRKPSLTTPLPSTYVRSVLSSIGQNGGAVNQPHISTPYWSHAIAQWFVDRVGTEGAWLGFNRRLHEGIRERVRRKKEREEKMKKVM